MKKIFLLVFLPIISFGQTTPTMRQVANSGTTTTKLPAIATATVSATDTVMVFKNGIWQKTKVSAIPATQTITITGGTGISTAGTSPNFTVTNTAPNQTVTLTGAGTTTVSGTYPTYTVTGGGEINVSDSAWSLTGNAGTIDGTNFIGTTDNKPFNIRVNNQKAGRIDNVLYNTFFGYRAGNSNVGGNYNTASGMDALYSNTSGEMNTAIGYDALYSNLTGLENTAIGVNALLFNTNGSIF